MRAVSPKKTFRRIAERHLALAIFVSASTLLTGCSQRLLDFTLISTKNVDLSKGADFKRGPKRVKGEDVRQIFVFIPTGQPSAKTAMDKAIESVPGAVGLTDGVITSNWFYIPYIYGQTKLEVEGTPLIDPNLESEMRR